MHGRRVRPDPRSARRWPLGLAGTAILLLLVVPASSLGATVTAPAMPAPHSSALPVSIVQTRDALASLDAPSSRVISPDPWSNISGALNASPSPREGEALVYDPDGPYVLLFGGAGGHGPLHDTWTFANGRWTDISANLTVHPASRYKAVAVWDAADGYVLLFGGHATPYLNDTWKFQAGAWTQLSPSQAPSPREDAMGAYDPTDAYVVVFGGEDTAGTLLNDTWTYAAGTWTNRTGELSTAPPTREAGAMTWDPADNYLVLFGGSSDPRGDLRDTWTYQGGAWTNRTNLSAPTPPKRETPMMADDPVDGFVLLFGGLRFPNSLNDSWAYSGGNWTQLFVGATPPARWGGEATWDPNGNAGLVLLFGGVASPSANSSYFNDTWTFKIPLSARLSASATHFDLGGSTNLTVAAAGGYPLYSYAWNGLPSGCAGANTSTLACQPTVGGTFDVAAQVTDGANGAVRTSAVALVVADLPTVSGTVAPLKGDAPLHVTFSSDVAGGTSPFTYDWAFGDGGSSTLASGAYTFSASGTFVPSLSISDADGSPAVAPALPAISVAPALGASIVASPVSGVAPLTVDFSADVAGGTAPFTYLWELGPAGVDSSLAAPVYVYESPGSYEVTVNVTDSVGSSFLAYGNITAGSITPLSVTATASPSSGAAPLTVQFSAVASGGTGSDTYAWSFGDGTSVGTGATPSHTYEAAGNYTATVTATDSAELSAQTTVAVQVTPAKVLIAPLTASFTYGIGTPYCASGTGVAAVSLNASASGGTGPYGYAWVVGTAAPNGPTATVTVLAGATTSMVLTASDASGDLVKVFHNATIGALSCTNSSGQGSSSTSYLLLLAIALVAILVAVEVVLLLRRKQP